MHFFCYFVIILGLLLCACNEQTPQPPQSHTAPKVSTTSAEPTLVPSPPTSSPTSQGPAAPPTASGSPDIPLTPAQNQLRVVATYQPAASMVFALRQPNTLVGVQNQADKLPLFRHCYPGISQLPEIGSKSTGVNVESIAALKPNLVILYPNAIQGGTQKQFEALGISTYLLRIERLSEIQQSLDELGNLLQVPTQAKQTKDELQRILNLVQKHLAQHPPAKKKRMYISASPNFLATHSHLMLQHEMIQAAGCEDVCTVEQGGWATISAEQLLLWNPDIAVISAGAIYKGEHILKNRKFQGLQAVQNKQVYQMPHSKISHWDYPSPDVVLGILWLAKTAYPESFADLNWDAELTQYYKTVYGADYAEMIK